MARFGLAETFSEKATAPVQITNKHTDKDRVSHERRCGGTLGIPSKLLKDKRDAKYIPEHIF